MLTVLNAVFTAVYAVIKWILTAIYTVIRSFLIGFFTVFIAKMLYYAVRDRDRK